MTTTITGLRCTAMATALFTTAASANDLNLPREQVDLVAPPFVHVHQQATADGPKIMQFTLTIREKEIVIDDQGTRLQAMTFNGSIPGPLMVVHEGDYVEVTLVNPGNNAMPHNIDFHSAAGAAGGSDLTLISPGEQAVLRWKATRTGVFVYHCIPGEMAPWHIAAGLSGAVMVLPRAGLKDAAGRSLHYDRVYYIGEQDFYVPRDENGKFKTYPTLGESYADTMEAMRKLVPSHVLFNGRVGALTGKNAMPSKVGETVLIVHSQADRDSRPHIVGGFGDYVWETGKFSNPPETDLETWFIRGGSAGAALYKFQQPGIFSYVNHRMVEAFEFGATAHFRVEGPWNDDLMAQVKPPEPVTVKATQR